MKVFNNRKSYLLGLIEGEFVYAKSVREDFWAILVENLSLNFN